MIVLFIIVALVLNFCCWCDDFFSKPKPRTAIEEMKLEVKRLKEQLAQGSRMRKQTPTEREATPSTFGYARCPLTEDERIGIQKLIDLWENAIRTTKAQGKVR